LRVPKTRHRAAHGEPPRDTELSDEEIAITLAMTGSVTEKECDT